MTSSAEPRYRPFSFLVLGLAVATTVSWGILFYAFSLFVEPMRVDLGWSKTHLNTALSLGLLAAGLAAMPVGSWIDHRGGHLIMSVGSGLGALLLVAWSFVGDPWIFLVIWFGIGLAQACSLYEPVFAVVTANVKDYKRAISFVTFLGGLASTIFLPLTHWLIEGWGWRTALLALAAIQGALSFGLYAIVLRGTRGSLQGLPPRAADAPVERSALQTAMVRPAFWALVVCFVGYGFLWTAVTFHIIPLMDEWGVALDTVVAALAMVGPFQVAGRLALFLFASNLSMASTGRFVVLLPVVAILLLPLLAPFGLPGLAVFAAVYGFGNGMITIVRGAGVAEILGTRGYGAISGAITLGNMLAKSAAPIGVALLWTAVGSYGPILWLWVATGVVSAVAFWIAAADKS